MNCQLFHGLLDDHLDGQLDRRTEADMQAHVAACTGCAALRAEELALRRSLRTLPVPAIGPGFAERIFAGARARHLPPLGTGARRGERSTVWWLTGGALAASLAIGVALRAPTERAAVPSQIGDAGLPVAHVQPAAAAGVQPVRLVFRTATALQDVTIEIDLPEGVELEGFPGQRRLTWQSDLHAGSNLLELPVRLTGGGGVLTATLNHGTERRRFAVQVVAETRHPAASSAPLRRDVRSSNLA